MDFVHDPLNQFMSVYVPAFGQWFNLTGDDYKKGCAYMKNHNLTDQELMKGLISGNIIL